MTPSGAAIRPPAVAGSFYPAQPGALAALVADLYAAAGAPSSAAGPATRGPARSVLGALVPHAGIVYSGAVAAAGWRSIADPSLGAEPTVVVLGTNHRAPWSHGIEAWADGAWRTPLGDVAVDRGLAHAIVGLGPPFGHDRDPHLGEHSIEVQLPLLQILRPRARIVPLSVSATTADGSLSAGERLGVLLARWRSQRGAVIVVISTDLAHYPSAADAGRVTDELIPAIQALDAVNLEALERDVVGRGIPGLVCGICGIAPTVFGLATLRAMGADGAVMLARATSADAGGPPDRTVGYLATAFDGVATLGR